MLQRDLPLYSSQPMIYFGSSMLSDEEDAESCIDPSAICFATDFSHFEHEKIGLFFHWHDLSL